MQSTAPDVSTIDATWQQVAERLGASWTWQRQANDFVASSRGWLQGPNGLRLFVHRNRSRWEIREALDTLVPGTGARLFVSHLYRPSERRPITSIAVAHARPAAAIAREIERRLLPGVCDALARVSTQKDDLVALAARRRRALDAILRLVPSSYQCDAYSADAPRLFLGPAISLDLRIDDADSITITRWSGLDIDMILTLIRAAQG